MIIDVTHIILGDVRAGGRVGGQAARAAIRAWLEENVGQYYGIETGITNERQIGSGWEFGSSCEDAGGGYLKIGWIVDIADPQLATMFMLRFA